MRYDVCLSFIGEDIRRTFLSHLLHSLDRKGITSVTSAASNPSENEVVRRSLVAVSVISKNYISLDLWVEEQARIIGCQRRVVPVFLRVDPLDVLRVVTVALGSAYINETRWRALKTVKNWLDCHVDSQSGFNSRDWEDDSQLVEQITLFISSTVTQDSIPHRWFPGLDCTRSPREESHSLEDAYGLYSHTTPMFHGSNPSESVVNSSWWDKFIRKIPFVNRSSNSSDTVVELSSYVAPMTPMFHGSNPSVSVVNSSWWDKFIRMIPFVNRSSNSSETIIEEASSGPTWGMMDRVVEVLSMLRPENSTEEVRTVGICGMEGVGKTTIAKYVYQEISSQFQHHFFMSNFSQKGNSVLEILASETNGSSEVIEEMVGRKVLLVADSVADIKQLKSLAKEFSLFGPGSRVIVVTQYRSLLFQCGVKHIHEVRFPEYDEAIRLFSQFAFRRTKPLSGFERFSTRAVEVAGGIPLFLKVLGSYLHGRDQDEWETTLRRLEKTYDNYTTEEVLKYIGADVSARRTRTVVEFEENEENRFPSVCH